MKMLCVFLLWVAVGCAQPASRRFMFMPDGDGKLHLVDLHETEPHRKINLEEDVSFSLYTKNNPTSAQKIVIGDDSTLGNFDPALPTRIVIHGWSSSGTTMDQFRQAYLTGDYNIIIVDWSGPAGAVYTSAKASSIEVGEYVGEMVLYLLSKGASAASTNIAGHSLGAHAAGVASNRAGSQLQMIIGMDPAAPLFGLEDLENRIDETDAQLVQIIHTSAGLLGWKDNIGHADFYPNGGTLQPGCGVDLVGSCSHSRSKQLIIESITTAVGFRATRCDSWGDFEAGLCDGNPQVMMGEHLENRASGAFYLTTAASKPFALG